MNSLQTDLDYRPAQEQSRMENGQSKPPLNLWQDGDTLVSIFRSLGGLQLISNFQNLRLVSKTWQKAAHSPLIWDDLSIYLGLFLKSSDREEQTYADYNDIGCHFRNPMDQFDGVLEQKDIPIDGKLYQTFLVHMDKIIAISENTLGLFEIDGTPIATYECEMPLSIVSFCAASNFLYCYLSNHDLVSFDTTQLLKQKPLFLKLNQAFESIKIFANEYSLFTVFDQKIMQWDLKSGQCLRSYESEKPFRNIQHQFNHLYWTVKKEGKEYFCCWHASFDEPKCYDIFKGEILGLHVHNGVCSFVQKNDQAAHLYTFDLILDCAKKIISVNAQSFSKLITLSGVAMIIHAAGNSWSNGEDERDVPTDILEIINLKQRKIKEVELGTVFVRQIFISKGSIFYSLVNNLLTRLSFTPHSVQEGDPL